VQKHLTAEAQRKTIFLLNKLVGAALAANNAADLPSFAAKAAPTKAHSIDDFLCASAVNSFFYSQITKLTSRA